jgi:uncharacterized membrane protein
VQALILILRLLHIVSGAFWVGTVVTGVFFVEPTAQALDREGERFVAHLVIRRRLAVILAVAAVTAIGAGAAMYWIDSSGLQLSWITTHTGLAFTAGGVAALSALAIAAIFLKPEVDRLAALEKHQRDAASVEEPVRVDEAYERRLRRWSLIQVTLLIVAISAMATARYIP